MIYEGGGGSSRKCWWVMKIWMAVLDGEKKERERENGRGEEILDTCSSKLLGRMPVTNKRWTDDEEQVR